MNSAIFFFVMTNSSEVRWDECKNSPGEACAVLHTGFALVPWCDLVQLLRNSLPQSSFSLSVFSCLPGCPCSFPISASDYFFPFLHLFTPFICPLPKTLDERHLPPPTHAPTATEQTRTKQTTKPVAIRKDRELAPNPPT